jgi:hypothetical protein
LVGVDKAQAAVLTYNFLDNSSNFFKVNNSSLSGIGVEYVTVSEGRFYGFTLGSFFEESKEYYDLAQRATAVFDGGDFLGLQAGGSDYGRSESIIPPENGGPLYILWSALASWSIDTYQTSPSTWTSVLNGYSERSRSINGGSFELVNRRLTRDYEVGYTLVDTATEPVPEPLTAGAAALALAGLSWLKHKKKMAA